MEVQFAGWWIPMIITIALMACAITCAARMCLHDTIFPDWLLFVQLSVTACSVASIPAALPWLIYMAVK